MCLKETDWKGMDWIRLAQDKHQWHIQALHQWNRTFIPAF